VPSRYVDRIPSSAKHQSLPFSVLSFRFCDKVYHKQEVCFLLYVLGQLVTVNFTGLDAVLLIWHGTCMQLHQLY